MAKGSKESSSSGLGPFSVSVALVLASGGQGAFLKSRPLDPQKTFYSPSGTLLTVI